MKRRIKKEPAVAEKELAKPMVVKTKAIVADEESDSELHVQADLVGSMWVFG